MPMEEERKEERKKDIFEGRKEYQRKTLKSENESEK
jgi:hypothetical protein